MGEESIHVCQHVFALQSDGENVSGAEMRLVANFFCVAYLRTFCVLMLKMWVRDEFWGCSYRGVFGGQKRFHGVYMSYDPCQKALTQQRVKLSWKRKFGSSCCCVLRTVLTNNNRYAKPFATES